MDMPLNNQHMADRRVFVKTDQAYVTFLSDLPKIIKYPGSFEGMGIVGAICGPVEGDPRSFDPTDVGIFPDDPRFRITEHSEFFVTRIIFVPAKHCHIQS